MTPEDKPYERNAMKNVMMPGMAKQRHLYVEKRLKQMSEDANTMAINRVEKGDNKIGFITSGIAYQYVKEVTQSCLTLWDPVDYTGHGILQARILE